MGSRHKDSLRQYIQQKRKKIAMLESLCDYCDELEYEVQMLKGRLGSIYEARTEVSNDEEADGSNTMDLD